VVAAPAAAAPLAPGAPTSVAEIAPELNSLPVDSVELRSARARFDETATALSAASALVTTTAAEISRLATEDARLTSLLVMATERKKDATIAIVQSRAGLRALAIDRYVHAGADAVGTDDLAAATAMLANSALRQVIGEEQAAKLAAATEEQQQAVRSIRDALVGRATGRQRMAEVQATHDESLNAEARLTETLADRQAQLDRARVTATVVGEDFALVALDAYWKAARAMAAERPACGLPWWALAGITRSESRHGTYGGARVLPDGDVDRIIVGIPLDGTNDTELIPDTDGGTYDGDPVYDRAVGPMQFIPSTWRRWARDGNGDRVMSPNNIYDATLAAASYLCASGPMQTDDQMRRGFLSYNHSDAYADAVLNYAKIYAVFQIPARQ
jgi:membrane-bound lytic murein transglycosylase B